jgi:hypothetical protein
MMDPIGVPFDKPIIQRKKPLNVILQIAAHYADTGAIFRGRLYWFPPIHRELLLAQQLRQLRHVWPRCAAPHPASASSPFGLQFSAELFHERAGRDQIGKTPPKIDFVSSNNCPSMPRLYFSRLMKVHHPAAQFDI